VCYWIMLLGSLAKGMAVPYSDIELTVVIEEGATESQRAWMRRLMGWVGLQIAGIGDKSLVPDAHCHPAYEEFVSRTPTELARRCVDQEALPSFGLLEANDVRYALQQVIQETGFGDETLFVAYRKALQTEFSKTSVIKGG